MKLTKQAEQPVRGSTYWTVDGCSFRANDETGAVSWGDPAFWLRCDELARIGVLRREVYPHLWGHTEFSL